MCNIKWSMTTVRLLYVNQDNDFRGHRVGRTSSRPSGRAHMASSDLKRKKRKNCYCYDRSGYPYSLFWYVSFFILSNIFFVRRKNPLDFKRRWIFLDGAIKLHCHMCSVLKIPFYMCMYIYCFVGAL